MITHIKHIEILEYECIVFHSYCFLPLFAIITLDTQPFAVYLGRILAYKQA